VGAGLLARKRAVGISGGFASYDDERDSDYELRWCRGAAGTAELNAQVAVSGFVDFAVGTVKVRTIQRHRKQQRRHRKEGDELAGAHLTQAIEHSAHLTALIADGFDLDGGVFKAKTEGTRLFPKCAIQNRIVDLGHSPAHVAHQELTAVIIFGAITTQERIQRVETMHESGFLEELQGSVNSGRGGLFPILGQFCQDLIGPDRLMLAPHDLENAPTQRGQVHLPRRAHFLGRRDRPLNAARVVMRRSLSVCCSRHTALFCSPPRLAEATVVWGLRHSTVDIL
jgi:hypothetical protein